MSPKLKYSISIADNIVKLYINGILHVAAKQDELIGFQSWITGTKEKLYHIEYYFKKGYFYSEYDDFDKWKNILQLLDANVELNDIVK